jgi:type VI secretion system protein ImpG
MKDLLDFYKKELTALRNAGGDFGNQSALKAIALAFARIHYRLNDSDIQLTQALLQFLFPSIYRHVPAFSIVQLKGEAHHTILQGELLTALCKNTSYYFRTVYSVTITAAYIRSIQFFNKRGGGSRLNINLRIIENIYCPTSLRSKLRFYIHMNFEDACVLYKLLFDGFSITSIYLYNHKKHHLLDKKCIRPVGLNLMNTLLFDLKSTLPPEQLLYDYFSFPEKFLFFDVDLSSANISSSTFVLSFTFLKSSSLLSNRINKESLMLNCTPIINLFECTSEYIKFDNAQMEYKVTPQLVNGDAVICIYDIVDVWRVDCNGKQTKLMSFDKINLSTYTDCCWSTRREKQKEKYSQDGEQFYLILSNTEKNAIGDINYIKANLLCCHKKTDIDKTTDLIQWQFNNVVVNDVTLLCDFSKPILPLSAKKPKEIIASLLTMTKQLLDSHRSLKTLKQMLCLMLTNNEDRREKLSESILSFFVEENNQFILQNNITCFVKGLKVSLVFDDNRIQLSEIFLFWTVFCHFFSVKYSLLAPMTFYLIGKFSSNVICCNHG